MLGFEQLQTRRRRRAVSSPEVFGVPVKNSDLHRPVGLEHVEQPLANGLFLLGSRHIWEVAGVEVRELVPGRRDNAPPN